MSEVTVRSARPGDWPVLWPILREVIRAGDSYCLPVDMTEEAARAFWMSPPPDETRVAEVGGTVLGTAHLGPNRAGPGDHVMNASYMVPAAARGRGVGRALVADSLDRGRTAGFSAVVFNAVTEVNPAITLYRRFGFDIVGTVPGAFRHPEHGPIALHVMHLSLDEAET